MAPDDDLQRRAWRALSQAAHDLDRKLAICAELDLSWTRVQALARLADGPLTLRALAERLAADPPYVTLIVEGLVQRELVVRKPHPEDRRAKLVELTDAGRAAAARAEEMLYEPPAALHDAAPEDLVAMLRVLDRLGPPPD